MSLLGRRPFLTGGLGLLGAGAVTWGGSLAACSASGRETAMLIQPLFVALADLRARDQIGQAFLEETGAEPLLAQIAARRDLISAALIPGDQDRLIHLQDTIRQDFAAGDVVLANRWVVARCEAQIAAARVSILS